MFNRAPLNLPFAGSAQQAKVLFGGGQRHSHLGADDGHCIPQFGDPTLGPCEPNGGAGEGATTSLIASWSARLVRALWQWVWTWSRARWGFFGTFGSLTGFRVKRFFARAFARLEYPGRSTY